MTTICENQRLADKSTLGIGGPAQYYTEVKTLQELRIVLRLCQQKSLSFFILGKGSNCLFDDRGFAGMVVANKINFCQQNHDLLHVGAGYSFALLGQQTAAKEWGGLEFAAGIPATVGGAIYMNAGAAGQTVSDTLLSVHYLYPDGRERIISKTELQFGYRYSSFQAMQGVIIAATFQLFPCNAAKARQKQLLNYRLKTQPYRSLSAGSTFRNPNENLSAGQLIEECGWKGKTQGAAAVSQLHANFLINTGQATSHDFLLLLQTIQQQIEQVRDIRLETEILYVPYQ